MKIQTLIDSDSDKEARIQFLKNWEELNYTLREEKTGQGERVLILEIPDEEFDKLTAIFPSRTEAMGAFATTASENGWEEYPERYVIYHADFDGNKITAGIKTVKFSPTSRTFIRRLMQELTLLQEKLPERGGRRRTFRNSGRFMALTYRALKGSYSL